MQSGCSNFIRIKQKQNQNLNAKEKEKHKICFLHLTERCISAIILTSDKEPRNMSPPLETAEAPLGVGR